MARMELACLVVDIFIAVIYFSAKRQKTYIHHLFSCILLCTILNIFFDMITVYTVNHLNEVPLRVNHFFHQIFIGSMDVVLFLTFRYIMTLYHEKAAHYVLKKILYCPLILSLFGVICLPLYYKQTPNGNYSYGPAANLAYASVAFYLVVSFILLFRYWKIINHKKRFFILLALGCELFTAVYQAMHPLSLLSGLGITVLNLSFYLTVESPDVHLIEQLQAQKERADMANKAKTTFIANISHEVRTPINAVLGMNEMIFRESREENIRQYSLDIETAAKTLYGIINDILDLSKIESGKMEIYPAEYDFAAFLHNIINMIKIKADDKKIRLETKINPFIPAKLYGDELRLKQVLLNLLSNAVKYTHEGTVTLRIEFETEDEQAILHFFVEDTGIGIKEEDMEKLFVAFERIEENRNRNIEGSGLGINISMQLLKLMGSSLKVSSEYGKGSVFSFVLKQDIIDHRPAELSDAAYQEKMLQHEISFVAPMAEILLVDDNELNRKVFKGLLKQTEVYIDEAVDGNDCLHMITRKHYDIIFLDHYMPGMDGIETKHRMEELSQNQCVDTPVIMLTANAFSNARKQYENEGFADFLLKPVVPLKLEQMIQRFLPSEKVEQVEGKKQKNECLLHVENLPIVDGIDWNYAFLHFPEMELLQYTVWEFYKMIPQTADTLEALCSQLEDKEKLNAYHIKIHALKSSAAMIGAIALSGVAKFLEDAAKREDISFITVWNPIEVRELREFRKKLSFLEAEKPPKKEIVDYTKIMAMLEILRTAMEEMDIDRADEIMDNLEQYQFQETEEQDLEELKRAVSDIDVDLACAKIQVLLESQSK